jgi:hypothetical protein
MPDLLNKRWTAFRGVQNQYHFHPIFDMEEILFHCPSWWGEGSSSFSRIEMMQNFVEDLRVFQDD